MALAPIGEGATVRYSMTGSDDPLVLWSKRAGNYRERSSPIVTSVNTDFETISMAYESF
jgi:hypothetical protein